MNIVMLVIIQVIEKEEIAQDSSANEQDQFGLASQIKAFIIINYRIALLPEITLDSRKGRGHWVVFHTFSKVFQSYS